MDIVIHAPSDSSGSLIRLLQSLQGADFFLSAIPRLTIELPPVIDPPTQQFLDGFRWPQPGRGDRPRMDQLVLRHRLPYSGFTTEQASIRYLESFYPRSHQHSHVLILAPNAQLSPLFYHYVKYTLLEYKYSSYTSHANRDMFGISLDLPSTLLDGTSPLVAPGGQSELLSLVNGDDVAPFLWQAPNSHAALYFAEKWIEFHDFLGRRLEAQHTKKLAPPHMLKGKEQPSWMEYLVELFKARGYYMLYPNFETGISMATIHHELHHRPEEFDADHDQDGEVGKGKDDVSDRGPDADADAAAYLFSVDKAEPVLAAMDASLAQLLPHDGDLSEVGNMAILESEGLWHCWPRATLLHSRSTWVGAMRC